METYRDFGRWILAFRPKALEEEAPSPSTWTGSMLPVSSMYVWYYSLVELSKPHVPSYSRK